MRRLLMFGVMICGAHTLTAQAVSLRGLDFTDSATIARAMPILAARLIAVDSADRSPRGLNDLFRLQIVAGRDDDANRTLAALHSALMARPGATAADTALNVQYQVFLAGVLTITLPKVGAAKPHLIKVDLTPQNALK